MTDIEVLKKLGWSYDADTQQWIQPSGEPYNVSGPMSGEVAPEVYTAQDILDLIREDGVQVTSSGPIPRDHTYVAFIGPLRAATRSYLGYGQTHREAALNLWRDINGQT